MNKFFVGLVGFGLVLGAGGLFLQHESIAELRGEVAMIRADLAKQQADVARAPHPQEKAAAVAVILPDNSRGDDERAELAKLREDVRALKASTQEVARGAQGADQGGGQNSLPLKLIPSSEWKNAGRATPSAAVETLLWAAQGGDVDTMTRMIQLDPAARAKGDALFAQLPAATQAEYGSPEKLVALFLAKDAAVVSGMQILGQRDVSADVVGVRVRVANDEGKTKEQSFGFQRGSDGLRLIITDKVVDKYAQQLAGGAGK